jgi:hypothetical protein
MRNSELRIDPSRRKHGTPIIESPEEDLVTLMGRVEVDPFSFLDEEEEEEIEVNSFY